MTKTVRELMHGAPAAIAGETTFKEVAELLADLGVSAVPVVDASDRVIGVVSEADLIVRDEELPHPRLIEGPRTHELQRRARASNAAELMTSPAVTVRPDTPMSEAAAVMRRHGVKRLPVCDADGALLGVVSRIDLVREFLREDGAILDEVIRVMCDELSIPPTEVRITVRDGVVTLEGTVEHEAELPMMEDRIRHVPGVVDVEARLRWVEREEGIHTRAAPWLGTWARN